MWVGNLMAALVPVCLAVLLLVLGDLSRRLGKAAGRSPVHRWFWVAAGLVLLSSLTRLASLATPRSDFEAMDQNNAVFVAYALPLLLGVVIGFIAAWRYWGWLIYARR
ncbi:MAG: hypothetical protein HC915_18565 [Anaerolineae bacterium]|nr:hypothetical protein [Anaerolineae bacterium]